MLLSVSIRISATCERCQAAVPLSGIVDKARCHGCGSTTALDELWWHLALPRASFAAAIHAHADREVPQPHRLGKSAGRPIVGFARAVPRCSACEVALDPATLAVGVTTCACGHAIAVRAADDFTRVLDPNATLIVGEVPHDARLEQRRAPVVFPCNACGASLDVTGEQRTIACTYCSAANFLPDAVWAELHPVPVAQPFFLLADYDEVALRELRWFDPAERLSDACALSASPAVLRRLSNDQDVNVRVAIAANPSAPPDLLADFARDHEADVRRELLANPATPVATLELLAADVDEAGRRALVANPHTPLAIVSGYATHAEAATRLLVVAHAQLPHPLLHQLAHDDDASVKAAARARLAELRAAGVDVGGGLFSRLLGT